MEPDTRLPPARAVEIEVRPVRLLRDTPGARDAFGPLVEAVAASGTDLARLRIQYRHNFRETAMTRPVLPAVDGAPEARELAVDLRPWARAGAGADVLAVLAEVAAAFAADTAWSGTWSGCSTRRPAPCARRARRCCRSTSRSWPGIPNRRNWPSRP